MEEATEMEVPSEARGVEEDREVEVVIMEEELAQVEDLEVDIADIQIPTTEEVATVQVKQGEVMAQVWGVTKVHP